jgi:hypothetical protein
LRRAAHRLAARVANVCLAPQCVCAESSQTPATCPFQGTLRFIKSAMVQSSPKWSVIYFGVVMGWTGIELSADQEEDVNVMLRAAWALAYSDAFANYRCAVFRQPSSAGQSRVYFSPGARELGLAFAAMPCRCPRGDQLTLVAGDGRAWYACFDQGGFVPTVSAPLRAS